MNTQPNTVRSFSNAGKIQPLPRGPRGRRRRGAAFLEMALVLPILLSILLGIFEMGRVMLVTHVSTSAAREACRKAIIPGATQTEIIDIVNSYLDSGNISESGRVVSILDGEGNPATVSQILPLDPVVVQVEVPYSENTWGFTSIMGGNSLVVRSTMRRE